jgi:tetratricopeptide (TPR) repeat protein
MIRIAEQAAFHGAPLDGLPAIRALQRARPLLLPEPRLDWLLGVCLGAAGRYGAAFEQLRPAAAGPALHPEGAAVASLASSTLGSLYRQLGRHEQARGFDHQALDQAQHAAASDATTTAGPAVGPGVSDVVLAALVDARLGLAADSVGVGDVPQARADLSAALEVLAGHSGSSPATWRIRARSGWVRAEVALLSGDPATALVASREAVRLARAARAPRHEAKGLLFAAVAEGSLGRPDAATGAAIASLRLSVGLGAWPLVWPAGLVLSGLLPPSDRLDRALELASLAVELISSGLPAPMAAEWRSGADVQRLADHASVPG